MFLIVGTAQVGNIVTRLDKRTDGRGIDNGLLM